MSDRRETRKKTPEVPSQTRGQERRTTPPAATPQPATGAPAERSDAWMGWVFFAASMLTLTGLFQVVEGLTALFNSGYYVVGEEALLVNVDYTAWGWTHLILGVLAMGAALGLVAGQAWARVVGIVLAAVSAVVSLAFLSAYPVWAVMVIALDVLVIYGIAAYGKEAADL